MNTYWITFRIEQVRDHGRRYDRLVNTIADLAGGKWWNEPTSFILFKSARPIGEIAGMVAAVIDQAVDVALIGMPEFKDARIVGHLIDNDLLVFMPFAKKV